MNNKYREILQMPHHVSAKRPRMSMADRAAQFSPFAALTGHDAAIRETARLTDRKIELEESDKMILDEKLKILAAKIDLNPEITIVYFENDRLKAGGSYEKITGFIKKIDYYSRKIVMDNGLNIKFDDVYKIDGEILRKVYNEYK